MIAEAISIIYAFIVNNLAFGNLCEIVTTAILLWGAYRLREKFKTHLDSVVQVGPILAYKVTNISQGTVGIRRAFLSSSKKKLKDPRGKLELKFVTREELQNPYNNGVVRGDLKEKDIGSKIVGSEENIILESYETIFLVPKGCISYYDEETTSRLGELSYLVIDMYSRKIITKVPRKVVDGWLTVVRDQNKEV